LPLGNNPRQQCNFLKEKPKFPMETYVSNIFVIIVISYFFIYSFATHHWKSLEESYNFVVRNTSMRIHMQKLRSNKISNTFVSHDDLSSFSSWDMIVPKGKKGWSCSLGQLKFLLPWDMIVLWGKINFLGQQWTSSEKSPSSLRKYMSQIF
jgi:hypothetical protein